MKAFMQQKNSFLFACLGCLTLSGLAATTLYANSEDLSTYSYEYQQNMAAMQGAKGLLKVGLSTGWPTHKRNDTMTLSASGAHKSAWPDLALTVGTEFARARQKSGYSISKAENCYVEVTDSQGKASEIYHIHRSGNDLIARHIPTSDAPWN